MHMTQYDHLIMVATKFATAADRAEHIYPPKFLFVYPNTTLQTFTKKPYIPLEQKGA